MTHQEVWAYEKAMAADGPWEHWIHRAEKLAGHSLDGDQTLDGYSYDFAHEAFVMGLTPTHYLTTITR